MDKTVLEYLEDIKQVLDNLPDEQLAELVASIRDDKSMAQEYALLEKILLEE